ncbi:O-antigen translocase [Gammaproteobacteria bacterium]|nr:O-antigen translocase [Gammaproteobacteria bacterium]
MIIHKALGLSFLATIARLISGLIINKFVALFIGPAGLAVIGQFQNFTSIAMTAAQAGTSQGVIKLTSEYKSKGVNDELISLLGSASRLILLCSSGTGVGIIIFSDYLSTLILHSNEYQFIFVIYGLVIPLFAINTFLLAVLNGLSYLKDWAYIVVIQSFYGVLITSGLILFLSLEGALIAIATNQSLILFVTIWRFRLKSEADDILKLKNFITTQSNKQLSRVLKFSLMSLTSAIMVPGSLLYIRDYITTQIGPMEAGYWQGMWYISSITIMIITTTLSTYYLPKLSGILNKTELTKEIAKCSLIFVPITGVLCLAIFCLKDIIIVMLFSDEFMPMRLLFQWQLTGDFIKVMSFMIGYVTIAKAMTKTFIALEVFGTLSLIGLTTLMIDTYGLIGVTYAYTLNYSLYLVVVTAIYSITRYEN